MAYKSIRAVTYTGVSIALIVAWQFFSAGIGNTLVTGPVVNLILIVAVMVCGIKPGLTAAVVSPICAKLIGIGPFWTLIPIIALGNAALVTVWHFLGRLDYGRFIVNRLITAAAAAVVKFAVLYIGVVLLAVPYLLDIPAPAAATVSSMFSFPQLFTAFTGGIIAAAVVPVLKKAVKF